MSEFVQLHMHKTIIKNIPFFWRHASFIVKQNRTAMSQYKILFTQNFHACVTTQLGSININIYTFNTLKFMLNRFLLNFHYYRLKSYL